MVAWNTDSYPSGIEMFGVIPRIVSLLLKVFRVQVISKRVSLYDISGPLSVATSSVSGKIDEVAEISGQEIIVVRLNSPFMLDGTELSILYLAPRHRYYNSDVICVLPASVFISTSRILQQSYIVGEGMVKAHFS